MSGDLKKARELLEKDGYTCVLCSKNIICSSTERGVLPLVDFLYSGFNLHNFSAADKVVGKATAFLYVLLGVKEVYAPVMSERAVGTLAQHGIQPMFGMTTKEIMNRTGTGMCPMEQAVMDINTPNEALNAILNKLTLLKNQKLKNRIN